MLKVLVKSHHKAWCHGYLAWVKMTLQGQVEWGGTLSMFVFIQTNHLLLSKGSTAVAVACPSCTARCCASKIRWAIRSLPSLGSWLIFLCRIAHLARSFFCEIFSAWRSSLKTGLRLEKNRTKTGLWKDCSLGLSKFEIKDHKKTGPYGLV